MTLKTITTLLSTLLKRVLDRTKTKATDVSLFVWSYATRYVTEIFLARPWRKRRKKADPHEDPSGKSHGDQ